MTAEEQAWDALDSALEHYVPQCDGDERFTADSLLDSERAELEATCARCLVQVLCGIYAETAKVTAGFWSGVQYTPKGRARKSKPKAGAPAEGDA